MSLFSFEKLIETSLHYISTLSYSNYAQSPDWKLDAVKVLCLQGPEARESFVYNGLALQVSELDREHIRKAINYHKSDSTSKAWKIALLEVFLAIQ